MTTLQMTIEMNVQEASAANCERFNKTPGTLEILNSDGDRMAWAVNIEDAKNTLENMMGTFDAKWSTK